MTLTEQTLKDLLHICEQTKSAELTGHDNLVYGVITMDKFKKVVEFAKEVKDYLENSSCHCSSCTNHYLNKYWSE